MTGSITCHLCTTSAHHTGAVSSASHRVGNMAQRASATTAWVFTLNNPATHREPDHWRHNVRFCAWQVERGDGGTEHLQGYVQLTSRRRLGWLKRQLDQHAHWEPRRGTHQQALDYVRKADTRVAGPFEYGEPVTAGQRTDLDAALSAVVSGASDRDLVSEHGSTFVRYHRGLREARRVLSKPRSTKSVVYVLYGPTGTGKSKYAMDEYPGAFWKPRDKWWDGYNGESAVVIDEFYGWLPYDQLLRLLDRYPLLVEIKGGTVQFVAETIVLTSNKHPREWYDSTKCDYAPLERRLDFILYKPSLDEFVMEKPSQFIPSQ